MKLKTIHKRANWQLYDKDRDKQITLGDIRKLIVSGKDLLIVDEQSGDDITVEMLLHLITEKEQSAQSLSGGVLIA